MTKGVGTIDYMAPEVFRRKPVPFKGDMYSLGLILHFMLTKDLPDYDDNVKAEKFNIDLSLYSE